MNIGKIVMHIRPKTLDILTSSTTLPNASLIHLPYTDICTLMRQFTPDSAERTALSSIISGMRSGHAVRAGFKNTERFVERVLLNGGAVGTPIQAFELNYNPQNQVVTLNLVGELLDARQLRHELANSLNIIHMSNMLIDTSLNQPDVIDKYSTIIKNELQKTFALLNACSASSGGPAVPEAPAYNNQTRYTVDALYTMVEEYLDAVPYRIYEDGLIRMMRPSGSCASRFVVIQPAWMKIILDNCFKNIYGHVGEPSNRVFKSFTMMAKDQCIWIRITNTEATSYKVSPVKGLGEVEVVCKPDHSHGLGLIDNLCRQLQIRWSLSQVGDDYCFDLYIPSSEEQHHVNISGEKGKRKGFAPLPRAAAVLI